MVIFNTYFSIFHHLPYNKMFLIYGVYEQSESILLFAQIKMNDNSAVKGKQTSMIKMVGLSRFCSKMPKMMTLANSCQSVLFQFDLIFLKLCNCVKLI